MNAVKERTEVIQAIEAPQEAVEITLSERQVLNRLRKIDGIRAQIKALEKQEEQLRAEIIGDAQEVMIDNPLYNLQFKRLTSRRFDTKAFSAAHPKLYEQFRVSQTSTRFTYKFK